MTNFQCLLPMLAILHFAEAVAADPQAVIAQCRAATSVDLRIACLEAALLQGLEIHELDPALPPEQQSAHAGAIDESAKAKAPAAASNTAVAEAGNVVATVAAPSPQKSAAREVPTTDAVATAATEMPPMPAAEPDALSARQTDVANSRVDKLGAEQLKAQSKAIDTSNERFAVKVVAFEFVGRDKLRVRLENGQVWQQHASDRPNLYPSLRSESEFIAELWQTSRGSYRMQIPRANRVIRVERIQ